MKRAMTLTLCTLLSALSMVQKAHADALDWDGGAGNSNWFAAANWDPDAVPDAGDTVAITGGVSVLLSNTCAYLESFTITNATLTFMNWGTALRATNVYIEDAGVLTHAICDTNALLSNTNRVYLICSNLTVRGSIDADERGFRRTQGSGGGYNNCGGGYGGIGGMSIYGGTQGPTYGSTNAPSLPGSGGGNNGANLGTAAGGAIRIDADGHVQVIGTLSADGEDRSSGRGGCGSGGSVWITCQTFGGTGLITASGGDDWRNDWFKGAGGGGGRIAVDYSPAPQALLNQTSAPTVVLRAQAGLQYNSTRPGPGTIWVPDAGFFPYENLQGCRIFIPSITSLVFSTLSVSNGFVAMPPGVDVTISNDCRVYPDQEYSIYIARDTRLDVSGAKLEIGGDLVISGGDLQFHGLSSGESVLSVDQACVVTNSGLLHVYAGVTTGVGRAYGFLLDITSDLSIEAGAWIYPQSDLTNGGSVLIRASNVWIKAGGGINADNRGYGPNNGSGTGTPSCGGGSYGGTGGTGVYGGTGGTTYGDATRPTMPGSGGATTDGGGGGGLIWLTAEQKVRIDGTLTANGETAPSYRGSGSGGGICVQCFEVSGSGLLTADGGEGPDNWRGPGGGGRIALIDWHHDLFDGTISVDPGVGNVPGEATTGTIARVRADPSDVLLAILATPEKHGTVSPYHYGEHAFVPGEVATNFITTPTEQTNGMRYVTPHWWLVETDSGSPVTDGSATQIVVTMTTNLTMTFEWTNQYYLATSAGTNGTLVQDQTGWYTNAVHVEVEATANAGNHFLQWAGSGVPPGHEWDNPLDVIMSQTRELEAIFATNTPSDKLWTGVGTWLEAEKWTPVGVPSDLDTVYIGSGTCTVQNATRTVSLTVSNNAALSFERWNSFLQVSNFVVESGGLVTHAACDTNAVPGETNRVYVVCTNMTVDGEINVVGKGFPRLQGPGAGYNNCGGGYGGIGGMSIYGGTQGPTYGSNDAPEQPGSGGGDNAAEGKAGGGAVRVISSGHFQVNGTITADGEGRSSGRGGCGSGGGIWITCNTFGGAGTITASGGDDTYDNSFKGAGGGGGRIAINYDPSAQALLNQTSAPTVTLQSRAGLQYHSTRPRPGTIWVRDSGFFPYENLLGGMIDIPGSPALTFNNLSISNGTTAMPDGSDITVSNQLVIYPDQNITAYVQRYTSLEVRHADVDVGGTMLVTGSVFRLYGTSAPPSTLSIGQELLVADGGRFHLYSGGTNGTALDYGMLVTVSRGITLSDNSWIYPSSDATDGGSALFNVSSVTIDGTSGFIADGLGFPLQSGDWGCGPGAANSGHGASYGGLGVPGSYAGTTLGMYGSSNMPVQPGSSGKGSAGGGVVRIDCPGDLYLDGTLSAQGNTVNSYSGTGSGGSIYLICGELAGSGVITANGGTNIGSTALSGGCGGGGRIAIWVTINKYAGTVTADGGTNAYASSRDGEPGTIVWINVPSKGTVFLIW